MTFLEETSYGTPPLKI